MAFQRSPWTAPEPDRAFQSARWGDPSGPQPGQRRSPEAPLPEPEAEPVDVAALEQAAYEAGLEAGRAELMPALEQARRERVALDEVAAELQAARREALLQAAQDVGELVTSLTRRVLHIALQQDPHLLVGVIEDALARLPEDEEIWIAVRPEFVDAVRGAVSSGRAIHIETDPNLVGGCRVRTRYARIEATVEAAMEGIEKAVGAWLEDQC